MIDEFYQKQVGIRGRDKGSVRLLSLLSCLQRCIWQKRSMARKPRIEYEGTLYHVMSRGDHGEPIFKDDADREAFLRTVGEVKERTGWLVHAYVLMRNA